ncbi:DUF2637 domain-containing protein [Streptomyces cinnamoneus]|uniref:DUF2637 domain-containing protein n=1 Tax=Streptomyces cinnamoneus TaxID=53446 RepID=UPI001EFD0B1E|nr:DUF2637 domain-containing protein [Streptomyces cinnamoneus]
MTTLALSTPASPSRQVTGWDRAAITALGGAGCALSYDALQQMAAAIHVRGFLTYLFPLVIDGFIAYGVRALLVLRTASFGARLYVWTLFGTATAASIWANALHAIRLNQQAPPEGLHLGDATVGVLSTLAPLALAGAVHLHILVARYTATAPDPTDDGPQPVPALRRLAAGDVDLDEPGSAEETAGPRRIGRPPTADLDELVDLARPLFTADETPTRDTVRRTIRTAGHRISQERLTQVMQALRRPSAEPAGPVPSG